MKNEEEYLEIPGIVTRAEKSIKSIELSKKRRLKVHKDLIIESIREGNSTYWSISKHTALSKPQIREVFEEYPEVYKLYTQLRSSLVDLAVDNLFDIVSDPLHSKNYDASKFILSKYRSDLDSVFERHDEKEQAVSEQPVNETAKIVFKKEA